MDHTAVNRKAVGGMGLSLIMLGIVLAVASLYLWYTLPRANEEYVFVTGASVAASLLSFMVAVLLLRKL